MATAGLHEEEAVIPRHVWFSDKLCCDVSVSLVSPGNICDICQSPQEERIRKTTHQPSHPIIVYASSDLLRRIPYFASLLSHKWCQLKNQQHLPQQDASLLHSEDLSSTGLNPNGAHVELSLQTQAGSPDTYCRCIEFLRFPVPSYTYMFSSPTNALELLPVADHLLFQELSEACMQYLGAVPWTLEEEDHIRLLFLGSGEGLKPSNDVAARLGFPKERALETMKTVLEIFELISGPIVVDGQVDFFLDVKYRRARFEERRRASFEEFVQRNILGDFDGKKEKRNILGEGEPSSSALRSPTTYRDSCEVTEFRSGFSPSLAKVTMCVLKKKWHKAVEDLKHIELDTLEEKCAFSQWLWLSKLLMDTTNGQEVVQLLANANDEFKGQNVANNLSDPDAQSYFSVKRLSYLDADGAESLFNLLVQAFQKVASGKAILSNSVRISLVEAWVPRMRQLVSLFKNIPAMDEADTALYEVIETLPMHDERVIHLMIPDDINDCRLFSELDTSFFLSWELQDEDDEPWPKLRRVFQSWCGKLRRAIAAMDKYEHCSSPLSCAFLLQGCKQFSATIVTEMFS